MENTQIQKYVKPSALAVMATRFNVEPQKLLDTLKDTVFKGASSSELIALVVVANEYGLNPLTKEIYAFPAKGGGIVPVVSVDGWMRIVNQHPQMDGLEFEFQNDVKGDLESCTCIIYRKDRNRPIKVTEYFSECRRNTEPWKMAHRMLRHKALIQCARVAFGFSGIFDEDEAGRVASAAVIVEQQETATAQPVLPKPKKDKPSRPSFSAPEPDVQLVADVIEGDFQLEPSIEGEPKPEAEPQEDNGLFEADTPQKKLFVLLADEEILERTFIGYLKNKRGMRVDTIMGLSDIDAEMIMKNWQAIREDIIK